MKFIATSDWHLHNMRPPCRTDEDWIATQQKCLNRLANYAIEHKYPVLISGDIFDTPTVTPTVLNMMVRFVIAVMQCGQGCVISAGNHDLPYHQWDRLEESSYGTLESVWKSLDVNYDMADLDIVREQFGTEIPHKDTSTEVIMLHKFSVRDEKDRPPLRKSWTADDLLAEYPNARIIVVGDNHTPWTKKVGDRLVVNCGSLLRRNAGELKHPTGFYVVDTDTLEAEHVSLFDDEELGYIDTTYIETAKERETVANLYSGLIEQLKDGMESSYDFISTLENYVNQNENRLGPDVVAILRETLIDLKNKEK